MEDEKVVTADCSVEVDWDQDRMEMMREFVMKCHNAITNGKRVKVSYGGSIRLLDYAVAASKKPNELEDFLNYIDRADCLPMKTDRGFYIQFVELDDLKKAERLAKKCGIKIDTDHMRDFLYMDELEACGLLPRTAQA